MQILPIIKTVDLPLEILEHSMYKSPPPPPQKNVHSIRVLQ